MKRLTPLFIGGPGRSGTSLVADRLGRHQQVCTFPDVELKIFTEKGGLIDLWHSLGDHYSPNRAGVALKQFRGLCSALINGQFGQTALRDIAPAQEWHEVFGRFTGSLEHNEQALRVDREGFFHSAAILLDDLGALARASTDNGAAVTVFLEKTPHALLEMDFLKEIAPSAKFIHVMRDPRSIANSLKRVHWGPNTLEACCAWVAGYCDAWLAKMRNGPAFDGLVCLNIEVLAREPTASAECVCAHLGLTVETKVFSGAATDTLNGWARSCDQSELDLLKRKLTQYAESFGYDPDVVGEIKSSNTLEIAAVAS